LSEAIDRIFGTSEGSRRFEALNHSVEYLERRATEIVPPGATATQDEWLEVIVRMKQVPLQGSVISRSIYSPPVSRQPSTLPEVVRQVTWDSEADRKRSRDELLANPTAAVEYYEISEDKDWNRADSALRTLEERLARFPFDGPETPGLALTHPDYVLNEGLEHRRVHEIDGRRRFYRSLYLWLSWGTLETAFPEGQDSEFDSAWDHAWDALSEVCRPERQVQGYEAHYLVPPDKLAEFLTGAV